MWNRVLRRHALPALLTGALAACLMPSGSMAADANGVAQDVLSNPAYQSTFPGEEAADSGTGIPDAGSSAPSQDSDQPAAPPSDDSTEMGSQPPLDMPSEPAEVDADSSSGSGMDLRYLPLVLAAAAFLILAFYPLAKLRRQPVAASAESKTPAPRQIVARAVTPAAAADAPPPPPGPLDDAEQLAAAGRFSEAIHLVLLRLLAELRHLVDLSMADSLTSREILRRNATLPAVTREALGVVIGAVELCHFGGRRGDATLFRHCVDAYMRATGRGAAATGAA
jgi:hypothetical protein